MQVNHTMTKLMTERETLRSEVERQDREIERLRAALLIAQSWLDRWAAHVADCRGGDQCSCGLTRVRFDVAAALDQE